MARNSSLRQLKRINNKSRLKIVRGDFESAETLLLEEGKLSWGVDTEDANEHHLQEVLVASQRTNTSSAWQTRSGTAEKPQATPSVYIPTPDSTGVIDNYEELYPPNTWTDPNYYIRTSETADECLANALAGGFTYFMDERDNEWLEKNNEEARGEGTSAQGAIVGSTRAARSGKGKGKEPDVPQPLVVSEDEFELVMGLLEKVTHEKTEFLHHSLETGMAFPAFSEYQDTFTNPLPATAFAAYVVPEWIPQPAQLVRIARVIYPHWKDRRIDRNGHRIIPQLNFDESDTLNESYICFRRRDVKAIRKTRASQVTSSDKLVRLGAELALVLDIANSTLQRENIKKEFVQHSLNVWEKRHAFVELKKRVSPAGDKADDELLIDKERVPKKPRLDTSRVKPRTAKDEMGVPAAPVEIAVRPRERHALIQGQIENEITLQREKDKLWEDAIDNPYQARPQPYASKLWKYVPPPESLTWLSPPSSSTSDDLAPQEHRPRACRRRFGRGGRQWVDVRSAPRKTTPSLYVSLHNNHTEEPAPVKSVVDEDVDRRAERWKYDEDDTPIAGPDGVDEQDRLLVDDFDVNYMLPGISILTEVDHIRLTTNATLPLIGADGRLTPYIPFRLGNNPPSVRRSDIQNALPRAIGPTATTATAGSQQAGSPLSYPTTASAYPVSTQHQVKKLSAPTALNQIRASANGSIRQGVPMVAGTPAHMPTPQVHSSPKPANGTPQPQSNGVSVAMRPSITVPHLESTKMEANQTTSSTPMNGMMQGEAQNHGSPLEAHPGVDATANIQRNTPSPLKLQNQPQVLAANGYHVPGVNGYPNMAVGFQYAQHNPHVQQPHIQMNVPMQHALVNSNMMPTDPTVYNNKLNAARIGSPYMHVVQTAGNFNMQLSPATNMNLKLPPTRQMQWAATVQPPIQRQTSNNGGLDGAMSIQTSSSPPARTPSANGSRNSMRGSTHGIGVNGHSMSPRMQQQSPSAMSNSSLALAQGHSPPRPPATPVMAMASSPMPHQPVVGQHGGF